MLNRFVGPVVDFFKPVPGPVRLIILSHCIHGAAYVIACIEKIGFCFRSSWLASVCVHMYVCLKCLFHILFNVFFSRNKESLFPQCLFCPQIAVKVNKIFPLNK